MEDQPPPKRRSNGAIGIEGPLGMPACALHLSTADISQGNQLCLPFLIASYLWHLGSHLPLASSNRCAYVTIVTAKDTTEITDVPMAPCKLICDQSLGKAAHTKETFVLFTVNSVGKVRSDPLSSPLPPWWEQYSLNTSMTEVERRVIVRPVNSVINDSLATPRVLDTRDEVPHVVDMRNMTRHPLVAHGHWRHAFPVQRYRALLVGRTVSMTKCCSNLRIRGGGEPKESTTKNDGIISSSLAQADINQAAELLRALAHSGREGHQLQSPSIAQVVTNPSDTQQRTRQLLVMLKHTGCKDQPRLPISFAPIPNLTQRLFQDELPRPHTPQAIFRLEKECNDCHPKAPSFPPIEQRGAPSRGRALHQVTSDEVIIAMLQPFSNVPTGVLSQIDFLSNRLNVYPSKELPICEKLRKLYSAARCTYTLPQYTFGGDRIYELAKEPVSQALTQTTSVRAPSSPGPKPSGATGRIAKEPGNKPPTNIQAPGGGRLCRILGCTKPDLHTGICSVVTTTTRKSVHAKINDPRSPITKGNNQYTVSTRVEVRFGSQHGYMPGVVMRVRNSQSKPQTILIQLDSGAKRWINADYTHLRACRLRGKGDNSPATPLKAPATTYTQADLMVVGRSRHHGCYTILLVEDAMTNSEHGLPWTALRSNETAEIAAARAFIQFVLNTPSECLGTVTYLMLRRAKEIGSWNGPYGTSKRNAQYLLFCDGVIDDLDAMISAFHPNDLARAVQLIPLYTASGSNERVLGFGGDTIHLFENLGTLRTRAARARRLRADVNFNIPTSPLSAWLTALVMGQSPRSPHTSIQADGHAASLDHCHLAVRELLLGINGVLHSAADHALRTVDVPEHIRLNPEELYRACAPIAMQHSDSTTFTMRNIAVDEAYNVARKLLLAFPGISSAAAEHALACTELHPLRLGHLMDPAILFVASLDAARAFDSLPDMRSVYAQMVEKGSVYDHPAGAQQEILGHETLRSPINNPLTTFPMPPPPHEPPPPSLPASPPGCAPNNSSELLLQPRVAPAAVSVARQLNWDPTTHTMSEPFPLHPVGLTVSGPSNTRDTAPTVPPEYVCRLSRSDSTHWSNARPSMATILDFELFLPSLDVDTCIVELPNSQLRYTREDGVFRREVHLVLYALPLQSTPFAFGCSQSQLPLPFGLLTAADIARTEADLEYSWGDERTIWGSYCTLQHIESLVYIVHRMCDISTDQGPWFPIRVLVPDFYVEIRDCAPISHSLESAFFMGSSTEESETRRFWVEPFKASTVEQIQQLPTVAICLNFLLYRALVGEERSELSGPHDTVNGRALMTSARRIAEVFMGKDRALTLLPPPCADGDPGAHPEDQQHDTAGCHLVAPPAISDWYWPPRIALRFSLKMLYTLAFTLPGNPCIPPNTEEKSGGKRSAFCPRTFVLPDGKILPHAPEYGRGPTGRVANYIRSYLLGTGLFLARRSQYPPRAQIANYLQTVSHRCREIFDMYPRNNDETEDDIIYSMASQLVPDFHWARTQGNVASAVKLQQTAQPAPDDVAGLVPLTTPPPSAPPSPPSPKPVEPLANGTATLPSALGTTHLSSREPASYMETPLPGPVPPLNLPPPAVHTLYTPPKALIVLAPSGMGKSALFESPSQYYPKLSTWRSREIIDGDSLVDWESGKDASGLTPQQFCDHMTDVRNGLAAERARLGTVVLLNCESLSQLLEWQLSGITLVAFCPAVRVATRRYEEDETLSKLQRASRPRLASCLLRYRECGIPIRRNLAAALLAACSPDTFLQCRLPLRACPAQNCEQPNVGVPVPSRVHPGFDVERALLKEGFARTQVLRAMLIVTFPPSGVPKPCYCAGCCDPCIRAGNLDAQRNQESLWPPSCAFKYEEVRDWLIRQQVSDFVTPLRPSHSTPTAVVATRLTGCTSPNNLGNSSVWTSIRSSTTPPPSLEKRCYLRPRSACAFYVGWSFRRRCVCGILLKIRHANKWCVPGGCLYDGDPPPLGAVRKLCEKLLSIEHSSARPTAQRFLDHAVATSTISGPYGRPTPHSAYLFTTTLGGVDDVVDDFKSNEQISEALAVPLVCLDGTDLVVRFEGRRILLRDKIGFMRMIAARSYARTVTYKYPTVIPRVATMAMQLSVLPPAQSSPPVMSPPPPSPPCSPPSTPTLPAIDSDKLLSGHSSSMITPTVSPPTLPDAVMLHCSSGGGGEQQLCNTIDDNAERLALLENGKTSTNMPTHPRGDKCVFQCTKAASRSEQTIGTNVDNGAAQHGIRKKDFKDTYPGVIEYPVGSWVVVTAVPERPHFKNALATVLNFYEPSLDEPAKVRVRLPGPGLEFIISTTDITPVPVSMAPESHNTTHPGSPPDIGPSPPPSPPDVGGAPEPPVTRSSSKRVPSGASAAAPSTAEPPATDSACNLSTASAPVERRRSSVDSNKLCDKAKEPTNEPIPTVQEKEESHVTSAPSDSVKKMVQGIQSRGALGAEQPSPPAPSQKRGALQTVVPPAVKVEPNTEPPQHQIYPTAQSIALLPMLPPTEAKPAPAFMPQAVVESNQMSELRSIVDSMRDNETAARLRMHREVTDLRESCTNAMATTENMRRVTGTEIASMRETIADLPRVLLERLEDKFAQQYQARPSPQAPATAAAARRIEFESTHIPNQGPALPSNPIVPPNLSGRGNNISFGGVRVLQRSTHRQALGPRVSAMTGHVSPVQQEAIQQEVGLHYSSQNSDPSTFGSAESMCKHPGTQHSMGVQSGSDAQDQCTPDHPTHPSMSLGSQSSDEFGSEEPSRGPSRNDYGEPQCGAGDSCSSRPPSSQGQDDTWVVVVPPGGGN